MFFDKVMSACVRFTIFHASFPMPALFIWSKLCDSPCYFLE